MKKIDTPNTELSEETKAPEIEGQGEVLEIEKSTEVAPSKTANDRLKERYPDENPETPEDWESLRIKYMDENDANEKEINDLISSDVELAQILTDMMVNHLPFRAALARTIDVADLTPQQGDEDYEAWDKAYNERIAYNKQMVERQKEIEENADKSFENIDKFCEEKGYDEATKQSIIDFINSVFDAIVMKNISPELLEQLDKARTYDTAVRDAALEGEVKGRNANIEAQRAEEMEQEEGDGVPVPAATGGSPLQPKEEEKGYSVSDFWNGIGKNDWTKK